jgi:hypothetical protein
MWFHGASTGAPLVFVVTLVMGGLTVVALPESVERLGWGPRASFAMLFSVGLAGFAIPSLFAVDSGIAAFLSFMLFFGVAWFFAERAGHEKNVRLVVFALALRIVIASFELFEDLFVTGIVLVGCGAGALLWSRHKWASESQVTKGGEA